MFFDKAWSAVTEEEMDARAELLASKLGGWIFHEKVDFDKDVPHLTVDRGHSELMQDWIKRNK
jgi:hypothetical protein